MKKYPQKQVEKADITAPHYMAALYEQHYMGKNCQLPVPPWAVKGWNPISSALTFKTPAKRMGFQNT